MPSKFNDKKITQRDEDEERDRVELNYHKKKQPEEEYIPRERMMNYEEDEEDKIGLPKNTLARNTLPIPFTGKQDNQESDLKGWMDEDEEDPEEIKKSERPLVSGFRAFPNTAVPRSEDIRKPVRKDDDDKDDISGWNRDDDEEEEQENVASQPPLDTSSAFATIQGLFGGGRGAGLSQIKSKTVTQNVIRIRQPVSEVYTKKNDENDLVGWAD